MDKPFPYPLIAIELASMRDEDQRARTTAMASGDWASVESLDKRHTARMKEIVAEIGWPTIAKVGREGSTHAWLLVQHADLDTDFQVACLNLMKHVKAEDIAQANIAYLEDRILCATGQPQLYGTQFVRKDNDSAYEPYPIFDPERLDERRATMGLEPMKDYYSRIIKRHS